MKILILANNDVGLYKFRKELIKSFIEQKHEVYISLPYGEFVNELQNMGCVFLRTDFQRRGMNPLCDFKLLCTYYKLIRETKPNVVLTYTIKPNIYGGMICRIKRIPYIVNITGLGTAIENKGLMSKVLLVLYKISLRKAKCVYFQNEKNKNFFLNEKICCGNIKLIPGSGVNLQEFPFEEYPCKEEKVKLLFIGRIMRSKGIEEFLDCAEKISKENKDVEFGIIGDYEDRKYEEYIQQLAGKSAVVYYGKQEDVRPFIKRSHATVLPSYHEGMSNVLLETAAMGRPVLTTNISGCMETFDEGISGYGCESKDAKALVQIVRKFLELPHEEKIKMGLKGREKVEKEFDRNIIVSAYINEINTVRRKGNESI